MSFVKNGIWVGESVSQPILYLDTSALAKRYWDEAGSECVDGLYEFVKKNGAHIYTCSHTIAEIGSAAARQQREGRFTRDDAFALFHLFITESREVIHFIGIDEFLLYRSVQLMMNQPLKAGDGIHLAAAMELHSFHGDALHFVSDDFKLCNAALQHGLRVLKPSETSAQYFLNHFSE